MRGRPRLVVSYASDQSLAPTWTQRLLATGAVLAAVSIPFGMVPGLRWLGDPGWLRLLDQALIFLIAALGLNILTGLAGQVSLGHAFFMGVGAYTAAVVGGESTQALWGMGLPLWLAVPAAGVAAALIGFLVAPTAFRTRGLYLAIVTLGLVFIGQHIFRNWNHVTGVPELGRQWGPMQLALWDIDGPALDMTSDGIWFGVEFSSEGKAYLFLLVLAIGSMLVAKNISRTRVGRAFAAVRDRDVAAEIMGVGVVRAKTQAFAISSFFAGVGGALFATFEGSVQPETWNLLLSIQFVAMVLIGGIGTTAGTVMGTLFVVLLPRFVEEVTECMASQIATGGWFAPIADAIITTGQGDGGFLSLEAQGRGLSVFQMNNILYGLLIVVFLIFEPLGLYGIWVRIRNYWKDWPFTY